MSNSSAGASQVVPVRIPADMLASIDAALEGSTARGNAVDGRSAWIKRAISEVLGKAQRSKKSRARKAAMSRHALHLKSQFDRDVNRSD